MADKVNKNDYDGPTIGPATGDFVPVPKNVTDAYEYLSKHKNDVHLFGEPSDQERMAEKTIRANEISRGSKLTGPELIEMFNEFIGILGAVGSGAARAKRTQAIAKMAQTNAKVPTPSLKAVPERMEGSYDIEDYDISPEQKARVEAGRNLLEQQARLGIVAAKGQQRAKLLNSINYQFKCYVRCNSFYFFFFIFKLIPLKLLAHLFITQQIGN